MAKEKKFKRSAFDPTSGQSSSFFNAVATQVRADFEKDKLAKQHSSGELDDKGYINGLKQLAQNYRKGTGLRSEVQAERIGAAQQVAGNYQTERTQAQTEFADKALAEFNTATADYAAGLITQAEYTQKRDLYNEAIRGTAPIPQASKLTKQVLGGKFWDQYQSGRVRNMMREKQIKALNQEVFGQKIEQSKLKELAGSEATLGYIGQQLQVEKGVTRDLNKEREALASLTKTLGRLPTKEEIDKQVYG